MLFHASGQPYEQAAGDAATRARSKMEQIIEDGRSSASRTIARVMTDVPEDRLIRQRAMHLTADSGVVQLAVDGLGSPERATLSAHAFGQLCGKAGIPLAYARELQATPWGREVLLHALHEHLRNGDDIRALVRTVGSQVRGILSDSYKRIDSRPLVEAFVGAAQAAQLVPVEGHATETRVALKAMLPAVFEPAPHEIVAFGLEWENSDFGAGAHACRVFMLRLWCTNYAIAERAFRQVHLGRKLDDAAFSARTYQLETRAQASALTDIVGSALAPERVAAYCRVISDAANTAVDATAEISKMKALTKVERQAVTEAYNTADIERLPPGNSLWRLSNALSWVAKSADGDDRRLELEKLAGDVLPVLKAA